MKPLDPLLHQQLRLSIMSILMQVESAEFTFLLEKTEATRGNLSVQLTRLKDAGYIEVTKGFRGNYPLTTCRKTAQGRDAFEAYVKAMSSYLNPGT